MTISQVTPSACRYLPTCSQYTYEAISKYGIFKASGWASNVSHAVILFMKVVTTLSPETTQSPGRGRVSFKVYRACLYIKSTGGRQTFDSIKEKKLLPVLSLLIGLLLIIALLASGCTRGMSAVGWSGVLIGDDGVAYTGSKEGRLVSVDLNNSLKQYAEALRASSAGTGSCSFFGSGSGGGGCGGAAPSVAIYGTPATATVPVLGKLIYLAGYNGKVFAYDAVSLQSRWVYPVDAYISPIVSGIVVDGDSLYFGCTDGAVYSLDTATGAMKWRVETEGEVGLLRRSQTGYW